MLKIWNNHRFKFVLPVIVIIITTIFILIILKNCIPKGFFMNIPNQSNYNNLYLILCLLIVILFMLIVYLTINSIQKNKELRRLIIDLELSKNNHERLKVRKGAFNNVVKAINELDEMYQKENDLLFSILDDLPIGIVYYNKRGNPRYVNKNFTKITGFNEDEIKNFDITGNILSNSEHVFWETLKTGKSFFGFESFCPTKSGKEVPVKTSTNYLYDDKKQVIGIISSLTNVSEQERLKKVEHQSKLILDRISEGIITVDNFGIINGFNRGAEIMTGFSEKEVIGKNYEVVFIKGGTIFTKINLTLKTGKEFDYKEKVVTPEGRKIYLVITTKILRDENDCKIGAIGIYKNITEIEELAYQKQQTEKLVMIGSLAAETADEIKNPLTSIKGFTQMIKPNIKDKDSLDYVSYILNEVDSISEIIDKMHVLAKSNNKNKK